MRRPSFTAAAALSLTLGLAPLPVLAQQQTATASNGTVNAQAAFTFGNGSLTISLTNMLAPGAVGSSAQAISDLMLTLSNSVGTTGATTASGQLGNVSSTGVVTYTAGSPTRWLGTGGGTFSATGNTITLEALGGGQPSQLILPFLADGGTYTSANAGVSNFNPYVIGPATFTLFLSGVTTNTRVTAATFSFGTQPETNLAGTISGQGSVVPEPATLALVGLGLVGVGVVRRRRA